MSEPVAAFVPALERLIAETFKSLVKDIVSTRVVQGAATGRIAKRSAPPAPTA